MCIKRTRPFFAAVVVGLLMLVSSATAARAQSETYKGILRASFNELVEALPGRFSDFAARVRLFIEYDSEPNAYSTYVNGRPVVVVTHGLIDSIGYLSLHLADADVYGNSDVAVRRVLLSAAAEAMRSQRFVTPSNLAWKTDDPQFRDAFVRRVRAMMSYVLGHELGHLCLGHVDRAYKVKGYRTNAYSYLNLHRVLASHQMELDADRWGVYACGWTGANVDDIYFFGLYNEAVEVYQRQYGTYTPTYMRDHPDWASRNLNILNALNDLHRRWGR